MGEQDRPPEKPSDGDKRERPENEAPAPAKIQPVKKTIGEGRENLRGREAWFRKRTKSD